MAIPVKSGLLKTPSSSPNVIMRLVNSSGATLKTYQVPSESVATFESQISEEIKSLEGATGEHLALIKIEKVC